MASRIILLVSSVVLVVIYSAFSLIAYLFGAALMENARDHQDRIVAVALPVTWLVLTFLMGFFVLRRPAIIEESFSVLKRGLQVSIEKDFLALLFLLLELCLFAVTLVTIFKARGLL